MKIRRGCEVLFCPEMVSEDFPGKGLEFLWRPFLQPEITADISERPHKSFTPDMTSEKRETQKFHTDDVSLPRSEEYF